MKAITRFRAAGLIVEGESRSKTAKVRDPAFDKLAHDAMRRFAARAPVPKVTHSASIYMFAWTPPGSPLGSIALPERPAQLFRRTNYDKVLAVRLQLLFDNADDADREEAVREIERHEPYLNIEAEPGRIMALHSEWLRDRIQFPAEGILPEDMIHEPETLEVMVGLEDGILSYIAELYQNSDY